MRVIVGYLCSREEWIAHGRYGIGIQSERNI